MFTFDGQQFLSRYSLFDSHQCMMQCWDADPDERPTFTQLTESFGNMLQASVKDVSISDLLVTSVSFS